MIVLAPGLYLRPLGEDIPQKLRARHLASIDLRNSNIIHAETRFSLRSEVLKQFPFSARKLAR